MQGKPLDVSAIPTPPEVQAASAQYLADGSADSLQRYEDALRKWLFSSGPLKRNTNRVGRQPPADRLPPAAPLAAPSPINPPLPVAPAGVLVAAE